MGARYQDGARGQFLSQDPVFLAVGNPGEIKNKTSLELEQYLSDPQHLNSYSYVKNNPLKYNDPSGEFLQFLPVLGLAIIGSFIFDDTNYAYAPDVNFDPASSPASTNIIGQAVTGGEYDNLSGGGKLTVGVAIGALDGKPDFVRFGKKIEKQITKRGWTKESISETTSNPNRVEKTTDIRWNKDGTRNSDPATAYINEDGSYVIVNNNTSDIVQISNRNDPNWKSPFNNKKNSGNN